MFLVSWAYHGPPSITEWPTVPSLGRYVYRNGPFDGGCRTFRIGPLHSKSSERGGPSVEASMRETDWIGPRLVHGEAWNRRFPYETSGGEGGIRNRVTTRLDAASRVFVTKK